MDPAITASPCTSITTGVLAALRRNVMVTPLGIFTEVKLKTPLGGNGISMLTVGLKAPSAPVLPLSKANPGSGTRPKQIAATASR
jgi:hypothetical protein